MHTHKGQTCRHIYTHTYTVDLNGQNTYIQYWTHIYTHIIHTGDQQTATARPWAPSNPAGKAYTREKGRENQRESVWESYRQRERERRAHTLSRERANKKERKKESTRVHACARKWAREQGRDIHIHTYIHMNKSRHSRSTISHLKWHLNILVWAPYFWFTKTLFLSKVYDCNLICVRAQAAEEDSRQPRRGGSVRLPWLPQKGGRGSPEMRQGSWWWLVLNLIRYCTVSTGPAFE